MATSRRTVNSMARFQASEIPADPTLCRAPPTCLVLYLFVKRHPRNKHLSAHVACAMRTGVAQGHDSDIAIAVHFAVFVFVSSLLGLGFYELMQPRQIANVGLAAYDPPPRTVITYPPAGQFTHQ